MNQPGGQLPWWQRGVIYQIYPRSFYDSNGNGIGDLQGIIQKLDYLNDGTPNSLGVDAIWLSPIFPSPMADFGYDVADYCDVDPMFGDLATFDRLVTEAHQRGIKIIIDYVPNHTSDQHPWFLESRSSRDNPKRDWYIWRDAKAGWRAAQQLGQLLWRAGLDAGRTTPGSITCTSFCQEQPELNWRNPEVRAAMLDVLRFWLERGVDGFRMDVIGLIIKDERAARQPAQPARRPQPAAQRLCTAGCCNSTTRTRMKSTKSSATSAPCWMSSTTAAASANCGAICHAGCATTARTAMNCNCPSTSA